jgi:hypothetical protein
MRFKFLSTALCIASLSGSLALSAPTLAPPATLQAAQSAVLQTDGPRATKLFEQMLAAPGMASAWDKRRALCSLARLSDKRSIPIAVLSGDDLADSVVGLYRTYWHIAMNPAERTGAETRLFDGLRKAIRRPDLQDRDAVLMAVSEQLTARGIYTTQGKTAALYDLLLYLQEENKPYTVALTDGTSHETTVFLMRSMVSAGWARYFNCGGPGTGGFATDKGLYAIAEIYDLDGEDFLVNFLAHETRHFADYRRYPKLEGPELEYRAKLTELALADKTLVKTLALFDGDQGDDRSNPHSYANKRVLAALRRHLGMQPGADLMQVEKSDLQKAARALLLIDNEMRHAASK